ncbi:MAG: prepilin-type N-terminal cleavage/methylation domain-containing protein [Verrucomicrobiales bacterium]|nr:prepilin-type N-terminal cleavage/methylation domain-containing protein [Verrucomicrobiales bacterium]
MKLHPHSARHRSSTRAFTLIELLVVIGIIAILASLAIPVTNSVIQKAYKVRTQAVVKDLQVGINGYITEYNRLPSRTATSDLPIKTDSTGDVLSTLLAENTTLNPRTIIFFNSNMAKNGRGGLVDNGGTGVTLTDNWGNPYWIIMDGDNDNKITPNPDTSNQDTTVSTGAPPTLRTRVAVYSMGPDGQQYTKDDIVSWR